MDIKLNTKPSNLDAPFLTRQALSISNGGTYGTKTS